MATLTALSLISTLPLPNSTLTIPRLGFGVWESHGTGCISAVLSAVLSALKAGYRHIDTAQYDENEALVGEAVRQSGVQRSEIFITTKYDEVKADIGAEHRRLVWLALEGALDEGRVKAIGVSNYGIRHIEEMRAYVKMWPPMINQNELHPWCQQLPIVEYCLKHGIVVQAYSPLARSTRSDDSRLQLLRTKSQSLRYRCENVRTKY